MYYFFLPLYYFLPFGGGGGAGVGKLGMVLDLFDRTCMGRDDELFQNSEYAFQENSFRSLKYIG